MDSSKHFTGPKVVLMLDAPAVCFDLTGGSVRIEKAGITAVGLTQTEAAMEWRRKFIEMISRPCSLSDEKAERRVESALLTSAS